MIEVTVKTTNTYRVQLPVESFQDIFFENMPREESDEMIRNAIYEKYKVYVDDIDWVK